MRLCWPLECCLRALLATGLLLEALLADGLSA